jgi:DNA helicase HerA-like ATPase
MCKICLLSLLFLFFFTILMSDFVPTMTDAYNFDDRQIRIGNAMYNAQVTPVPVHLPLSTLNRHGLISGATGTGKTKSLQMLVEQLSIAGVPTLVMDVKGDLSGLSQPGENNPKIASRVQLLGIQRQAQSYPVEFLTISGQAGVPCRSTVTEFGPVLLSKILELNVTQSSILSLVFKFCDDQGMLLLDLQDLIKVLQYMIDQGKQEIKSEY